MKPFLTSLLATSLILSACGWQSSRLNPGNWFGNSRPPADVTTPIEASNTLIPAKRVKIFKRPEAEDTSVLITNITELKINATPSGAIVLAEGVAGRQGAYDAELRPVNPDLADEKGVLELEFRVRYPVTATPVGSNRSREVIDAFSLTNQELQSIRVVRVRAAQNFLESRRR